MKNLYLLLIEALYFACNNSNTVLNNPTSRTKKSVHFKRKETYTTIYR